MANSAIVMASVGTRRLHSYVLFDGCRLSTLVCDTTICGERMEEKKSENIEINVKRVRM